MKKLFLILVCVLSLYSCRSVETITVTEYKDRYITQTKLDSVYLHVRDSIFLREKNDTIRIEIWKTIYKDRLIQKTDTCYIEVEKINTHTIEKQPSKMGIFFKYSGILFWVVVLAAIVYLLLKTRNKLF